MPRMKRLTFHGPGLLQITGFCTLEAGKSVDLDADFADTLVTANPEIALTATAIEPARRSAPESADIDDASASVAPEARQGEGQPPAHDTKE